MRLSNEINNDFKPLEIFSKRMSRIGIDVEFVANSPWIYLEKVNGVRVRERFLGNHGFTAFWLPVKRGDKMQMTDIGVVFREIRRIVKNEAV